MNRLRFLVSGILGAVLASSPILLGGNAFAASAPNSLQSAVVTVTGNPLPAPTIPANAITLAPGQAVPTNAPVGQSYILPQVLPPNSSQDVIVHADPGQAVHVSNYSDPVVIVPSAPTVATIEPPSNASSMPSTSASPSTTSFAIPSTAKQHTRVLTAFFEGTSKGNVEVVGGIMSSGSYFIADNHVFNYYDPNNATYTNHTKLTLPTPTVPDP